MLRTSSGRRSGLWSLGLFKALSTSMSGCMEAGTAGTAHGILPQWPLSLTAQVQNDFPFILRDVSSGQNIKISGELAHALLRLPKHVLPHTFRQRQGSPRLTCGDPSKFGCTSPNCPMAIVHQFFALRKCPETSCTRSIDQLLTRAEQKLVDTMLVADLIHLASSGETSLAIVSSDDDLWPGMLMAMSNGTHVVHVCTKHLSDHRLYRGAFRSQYTQGRL